MLHLRHLLYPPRMRGLYCVACFVQDRTVQQFRVTDAEFLLDPHLYAGCEGIISCRSLCRRCRQAIDAGDDLDLRTTVGLELLAAGIDPELGITVALWWLRRVPLGALTPGLQTWCAILHRYPQEITLPSIAERDLGNGITGTFATFGGGLWIDNFVSRDRRKGHARNALQALCTIADAHGSTIAGKVEPNTPPYLPNDLLPRAPIDVLLGEYARVGFERWTLPFPARAVIVMRQPKPPPS